MTIGKTCNSFNMSLGPSGLQRQRQIGSPHETRDMQATPLSIRQSSHLSGDTTLEECDNQGDKVNSLTNPANFSWPWHQPFTVLESKHAEQFRQLKKRLASVPHRTNHQRQTLYVDRWTGQHWLGLLFSSSHPSESDELLKPVSHDTAMSIQKKSSWARVTA